MRNIPGRKLGERERDAEEKGERREGRRDGRERNAYLMSGEFADNKSTSGVFSELK